jgi:hypothetical protein
MVMAVTMPVVVGLLGRLLDDRRFCGVGLKPSALDRYIERVCRSPAG